MIIYSLRLAIFGSRFHPVRCRCYHPSWLDKNQRTLLWGLPDLSPQDTRTCWLSGEQVSLRNLLFFGKVGRSLYSITALFWRREARRLVLSERNQQRYCSENLILFIFLDVLLQSFKDRGVISNHDAKSVQAECRELVLCRGAAWFRGVISNHSAKV